jgi:hypothetical protein
MVELGWPPATIAAMTLEQVACLASKKPPGKKSIDSAEDHAAQAQAEKKAEREWRGN